MARVFVNHLIDLVCKEKEAAIDSERKLLLGHPLELAKKGIAILNVRELENEREFKFKRWKTVLVPFSNELPRNKIVAGDTVQIREQGKMFDPYDENNTGTVS
ncbi:hypothetical protein EDC94DRAFT_644863 [Helicostylum pulchrum]|nr:hypothetical protein EDC94DRAFT_644863 [Helicostylum pulchrum]